MGRRIGSKLLLEKEIKNEREFEEFLFNAFDSNPQYPLMIRGRSAVIRFQINSAEPGYFIGRKAGFGAPSLQTVIVWKGPKLLVVATEYGFRGSNSKGGHGKIGHQQILTILKAYDHGLKQPRKVEVVNDISAQDSTSVASQITEMKQLLDSGVITREEFEQFKKKLLM